jgi:hypothetical protein
LLLFQQQLSVFVMKPVILPASARLQTGSATFVMLQTLGTEMVPMATTTATVTTTAAATAITTVVMATAMAMATPTLAMENQ